MDKALLKRLSQSSKGGLSVGELKINTSPQTDNSNKQYDHRIIKSLYDLWRQSKIKVFRIGGSHQNSTDNELEYSVYSTLLESDIVKIIAQSETNKPLKVVTWNVNSIRARNDVLFNWLTLHQPDIVCIQETKTEDQNFPQLELKIAGYNSVFMGQKSYNGVCVLSRFEIEEVKYGFDNKYDIDHKRLISVKIKGIWYINVYVPQGSEVTSEKFHYKLEFLSQLIKVVEGYIERGEKFILLGDINIAPDERDVVDPKMMADKVSFHPKEHAALKLFFDAGLEDVYRNFETEGGKYSWFDFRTRGYEKGEGMRIDLILASPQCQHLIKNSWIDLETRGLEKTSDHAPVFAEIEL